MPLEATEPPARVRVALVGAGRGGSALLDLLLDWPAGRVVVIADRRPDAPGVLKAKALGIPTVTRHGDVFAHGVNLVLEVTGRQAVLDDLLRAKPPGVEVIGAGGVRFFWDLLEQKANTTRQLQVQLDMALALGSAADPRLQVATATQRLAQACGVDRCAFLVLDDATGLLIPVTSQFATGEANERMWSAWKRLGELAVEDVPFFAAVMERRSPIEIEDAATSPLMPPGWVELFEVKSALVLPIFRKDQVVGTCMLDYRRERRRFTPEQATLAMTLAGQVSLAVENARLYRRAEDRAEKLTALSALTRLITSVQDTEQVFPAIARAATLLLGATTTRVWVDDAVGQVLQTRGSFGIDPNVEEVMTDFPVIPYGQGLVGRIFLGRTPEYLLDIGEDPRWLNKRLATEVGLHGFAGVPLIAGDVSLGVLSILFKDRRRFTDEEKEYMRLLADQAAIALENLRLYAEGVRRRREAEELARVARMLTESLDVGAVAERIVLSVLPLFGAIASGLYLAQPDGSLKALAWGGRAREHFPVGAVFPPGIGIMSRAVATGAPAWTADILSDRTVALTDELRRGIVATGNRAVLAVPLRVKGEILGVLMIGDQTTRPFSQDEVSLLQTFADHAAFALENARLYQRAQDAYQELARAQAQLVRGETLRAMGELTSGAAHHLNNLLAVMIGRLQLALLKCESPDIRRHLEPAERAAQDGAEVVRRLARFGRSNPEPTLIAVDLNQLVEEVVELTRPRWQNEAEMRGVRIDVTLEAGAVPRVAGDPPSLREVLVNLVLNAVDAMPHGGSITIRTWGTGPEVHCSVRDTGVGMSAEVQRRALEPFFTTKGLKSTGLGLSVNYGIIQRHGGELAIESAEGRGTTVTVRLPVATVADEPPPDAAWRAIPPLRILVIDDEMEVRKVITDILADDGHTVVGAADGDEGLARLGDGEAIDLVLTDLGMPGMTGWEVARTVKTRRPLLPVGLVTGWGEDPEGKPGDRDAVDFVLAKPVTRESLRAAIAQARSRRSGAS